MGKMHPNELSIDLVLVRQLLYEQFPEFSRLPIKPVKSTGTVNSLFRLGQEFCIRLPRVIEWADIDKEWKWLPLIAPYLTLKIPEPVALGFLNAVYPLNWAIYKWINGSDYSDESIRDEAVAAKDLANFVNELHAVSIPADAPEAGRSPLPNLNQVTLDAIKTADDLLDAAKVTAAWEGSLKASLWNGQKFGSTLTCSGQMYWWIPGG